MKLPDVMTAEKEENVLQIDSKNKTRRRFPVSSLNFVDCVIRHFEVTKIVSDLPVPERMSSISILWRLVSFIVKKVHQERWTR